LTTWHCILSAELTFFGRSAHVNIFSYPLFTLGYTDVIPNTALDLALVFGVDMFGVLCSHCSKLVKTQG